MRKKAIILISGIMLVITAVVVITSCYIVSLFAADSIPYGVSLGDLQLGELTLKDANNKIDNYYPDYIRNRNINIVIEGKTYMIPMENVGVRLDKTNCLNEIIGKTKQERVFTSIRGLFDRKERKVQPIFECNEKLLTLKINEMKGKVDRASLDAIVVMKDETIEKKPEVYGLELGVENTVNTIKLQLRSGNIGPITLKLGLNADFRLIEPQATMSKIDEINGIIGDGMTRIEDEEKLPSIIAASKAINNVFIVKRDTRDNVKIPEFSFLKCLEDDGFKVTKNNPGVNQVASTLNAALIKSGFPTGDIDITADLDSSEYTPNIKRIKVTGTLNDFKFRNNTPSPMLIISKVKNNSLVVYILGKKTK